VVAPGVAEVEPRAGQDLRLRLLQPPARLFSVVDHQPEVPRAVGRLRATLAQDEELVSHIQERHSPEAPPELELEQAAIELERFLEVVDLEYDVVDAHETSDGASIGFAAHGGDPRRLSGGVSEPAIELDGLGRRYGERVALQGVTVRLPRGATLAVLGANGAGKTTLLRVLAGLLRPHAGTARVLGAELPRERWKVPGQVGYLAHEPLLYRQLTGRENLRYHARLHGVDGSRVREVLTAVGMERRADEPLQELSRGMIQRLAVARAVLHDPPLLLLDEPRANLDPAAADLLEPLIGRASGRTRVLVTHDVHGAIAESEIVLGLKAGRQAFAGEVEPAAVRELYR
jgi:heme exporter protein A